MPSDPILEIRNVSYAIGGRAILRDISLTVREGETVVLLGRSGSGKTTLLKAVNGLVQLTSGEIRFEGKPSSAWDPIHLRRRMGYVIQDAGLFPHWTVEANVGLVPRLENWSPDKVAARVELLLRDVGLDPAEFQHRYPRQLSGGQKQRVGIARALAADPPLLLLDEPFAALDPITRFDLQRQFLELQHLEGRTGDKIAGVTSGATTEITGATRETTGATTGGDNTGATTKSALFVTHDVREALMLGTRVALLKDGAIDVLATPSEFLTAQTPEASAFLASLQDHRRPA